MELLAIGAFARAARLSPKALRLYDELGLLPPACIDPASGYRFYEPAQLSRLAWWRGCAGLACRWPAFRWCAGWGRPRQPMRWPRCCVRTA
ncbi:MAG TPA: MerR family DNA-binding transcriptional regulator [Streptosporangiaceae bacterium]